MPDAELISEGLHRGNWPLPMNFATSCAAIDRLPDRQREVALLSLGQGLPGEVARVLEISEANVYTVCTLAKCIAQFIGVDDAALHRLEVRRSRRQSQRAHR